MITTIEYDGFDWTVSNIYKVQKHGISIGEIEIFFRQENFIIKDKKHSINEERYIAVGEGHSNRPMFVAFTIRIKDERKFIRVISARYMHRTGKEYSFYEKFKKDKK